MPQHHPLIRTLIVVVYMAFLPVHPIAAWDDFISYAIEHIESDYRRSKVAQLHAEVNEEA